jgi:hypothetical protein
VRITLLIPRETAWDCCLGTQSSTLPALGSVVTSPMDAWWQTHALMSAANLISCKASSISSLHSCCIKLSLKVTNFTVPVCQCTIKKSIAYYCLVRMCSLRMLCGVSSLRLCSLDISSRCQIEDQNVFPSFYFAFMQGIFSFQVEATCEVKT